MPKSISKTLLSFILVIGLFTTASTTCHAKNYYTNNETGYCVEIGDYADLLTNEEAAALSEIMQSITAYGNVAFASISENPTSAESVAESLYHQYFSYENGTIFLIDMDNRIITIYCEGSMSKTITNSYATTITDNVYRYASNQEYYSCAKEAFMQIERLLVGEKISQPMKYISNALLAILLSLLTLFGYVCYYSRLKKPTDDNLLEKIHKQFSYTEPIPNFTHETRNYSPRSSGSSSSSGRSSSHSSSRSSSRSSGSSRSRSSGSRGSHRF